MLEEVSREVRENLKNESHNNLEKKVVGYRPKHTKCQKLMFV